MGQGKKNRKRRDNQVENGNGQVRQQGGEAKKLKKKIKEKEGNELEEYGRVVLGDNRGQREIHLITIIGEVEGYKNPSGSSKTMKYDHILPKLAEIEDDDSAGGLLVLLNASGRDVDADLAIAEVIASLSLPTISPILDGSHPIGVPLAVPTNYSFVVPSGTMMIRPVRMTGVVIGTSQTYGYFEMIQDRILTFISNRAGIAYGQLEELMCNTEMLTRNLGAILVGTQTVETGLIDQVGGIKEVLGKLCVMIGERERR